MSAKSIFLLSLALLFFGPNRGTHAGVVVVPNTEANAEATSANIAPFSLGNPSKTERYQALYPFTQFAGGAIQITAITFRPDAAQGFAFSSPVTFEIDLSTTSVSTLSTTFANNVGGNNTVVVPSGSHTLASNDLPFPATGGPQNFDIVINLTTPFIYNPAAGNLLMDIRVTAGNTNAVPAFDADDPSGSGPITRVFAPDVTASAATIGPDHGGLVTQFTFVAPVPEPASLTFLGLTAAGAGLYGWRRKKTRDATA